MDCSQPGSSVHGTFLARNWSKLPSPPPWDLSDPGIEPAFPLTHALQEGPLSLSHQGSTVTQLPRSEVKVWFEPLDSPLPLPGKGCMLVAQSCPALCDPMDGNLPGSSVHGILQARILEGVAISFSKESSQPRGRSQVSRIAGGFCTVRAIRKGFLLSESPEKTSLRRDRGQLLEAVVLALHEHPSHVENLIKHR